MFKFPLSNLSSWATVTALALSGLTVVAGCATTDERVTTSPPAPPPAPTSTVVVRERVVTHPTGRYELRGEGTPASPFYWAWIPAGATVVTVPVAPAAPTVIVAQPSDRVVTYPQGRYELYGQGSRESPYYWVWVPTGATPPPPPALPTVR